MTFEVALKIWGNFGCFTRPETKVNRVSYDVITPSAARNILSAIYYKPSEFWYEITEVQVLNPIKKITSLKNERREKVKPFTKQTLKQALKMADASPKKIVTQRYTVYLYDVAYIIKAKVHVRSEYAHKLAAKGNPNAVRKIKTEFDNRVRRGQFYHSPFLGLSECMCFFSKPDGTEKPINESRDLGIMLYDVFDPANNIPLNTAEDHNNQVDIVNPSFFHAFMDNGVVKIPERGGDGIFVAKPFQAIE